MDADGSDVSELTAAAATTPTRPSLPTAHTVVFDRDSGSGRSRIYVVDVDGSGLHALTDGSTSDSEPVFTPNGRRIVYVSNGDSDARTDRSDIFAMAPDGANQRVLIDGIRNESEPDVSPTGRAIVFVSNRDHGRTSSSPRRTAGGARGHPQQGRLLPRRLLPSARPGRPTAGTSPPAARGRYSSS